MPAPPYDTLAAVVNTARVRLNDAIQAISGEVFTDTAVFTLPVVNAAWRRLQEALAIVGWSGLNRETTLTAVPAVVPVDQGIRVWFDWANYYDGNALQAAPVLPQDLILPIDLYERINGVTTNYAQMDRLYNGLPTAPRTTTNRCWEWRNEKVYMPGATGLTDIMMRYAGFLADFVSAGSTPFASQSVPIMRSLNSFAWFMCAEVAKPRGDMDAGSFETAALEAARYIIARDPQQGDSVYFRGPQGTMRGSQGVEQKGA